MRKLHGTIDSQRRSAGPVFIWYESHSDTLSVDRRMCSITNSQGRKQQRQQQQRQQKRPQNFDSDADKDMAWTKATSGEAKKLGKIREFSEAAKRSQLWWQSSARARAHTNSGSRLSERQPMFSRFFHVKPFSGACVCVFVVFSFSAHSADHQKQRSVSVSEREQNKYGSSLCALCVFEVSN